MTTRDEEDRLDQHPARPASTVTHWIHDLAANRPAASTALTGTGFLATDTLAQSYCTGTSWVAIGGSPAPRVVSVAGQNYALDGTEGLILVTTVGRTITLPDVTTVVPGRSFVVMNTDGGANTLVNTAFGNINTTGSYGGLGNAFAVARFVADGSSYWIEAVSVTYTQAEVADDYAAVVTDDWITMGATGKVVTLPDAALVPKGHPGFTVKVFGGSNCTVRPTQLPPPAGPDVTAPDNGGTVADGDYTIIVTYVNALGETTASVSARVVAAGAVADTSQLVIPSPPPEGDATGWNAYVSAVNGVTLYLQNVTPTLIGTDLTLTAPPSSITANPPAVSTASVCAIDGVATYAGLVADKSAATFKSNGVDYLVS